MIARILLVGAFVLCCSIGRAEDDAVSNADENASQTGEETITIPLEEVWSTQQKYFGGMEQPKTRYIAKLEEGEPGRGPLLNAIRDELDKSITEKADRAFAVEGKDLEALKNAHAVLVDKQPRPAVLPKNHEISIAFFSLISPYYTWLTDVESQQNTILIRYELIPHWSLKGTCIIVSSR